MNTRPSWQAFTIGDRVAPCGPYARRRDEWLVTKVTLNSDCGKFQYFTTAGSWFYHDELELVAPADEASVEMVRQRTLRS